MVHASRPRPNGRKPTNHRLVLDGIFWIARTGSPWRDLPEEFCKWSSVYRQFRCWTRPGFWEQSMDTLNESGLVPDALQMIDSTVVRAHHQAAGAKGDSETKFRPFERWLRDQDPPPGQWRAPPHEVGHHAGRTSYYLGFDLVVDDNLPDPCVLLADKGYASDTVGKTIQARNTVPVITM